MKLVVHSLAWLGLLSTGLAQTVPVPATVPPPLLTPAAKNPKPSPWVFDLIPKAFQKNPFLDLTVLTEMTEEGKKLPPVSPQAPAYYVAHSDGYHVFGEPHGGKGLSVTEVEAVLQRALAARGYLPASPGHPPTIMINYIWGVHGLYDQDNPALSDEQWTNNILERAALVGGEKFAAELNAAITQSDALSAASSSSVGGTSSEGTPIFSAAAGVAQMNAIMNPVKLFRDKSAKNEFLVDQASDDCYFVVASAFSYASIATHVKQLLWRTRMTANTQGVSQPQSVPTLIASAAPYFGVDMSEAETIVKRPVPDGRVDIGTPTVVESAPTTAPARKP